MAQGILDQMRANLAASRASVGLQTPDVVQAPQGPRATRLDPGNVLERVRANVRAAGGIAPLGKLGFRDAMRETFLEGGWKEMIPFFGAAASAEKYHRLWEASKAIEEGRQSKEDEELVLAFLEESIRPEGIGHMVGSILTELPGFVAEYGLSNLVWKAGKKVALKAMGKTLRKGVERAAIKSTWTRARRQIATKQFGKAAASGIKAGLRGLTDTAGQLGAMTLLGEMAGGSRIRGNAWRRALPEMSLSVDDADRLNLTFHSTAGDFVDSLPKAILDEFIELLSERSGEILMKGLGKVPGGNLITAMQAKVAQWWAAKNTGKPIGEFLKKIAVEGGWHGPLGEFLEERYGGFLRGLTGVDPGGVIENTFPGVEQMAAELIAFSVPTAMRSAGQVVGDVKLGEPIPLEGFERPPAPTRIMTQELADKVREGIKRNENEKLDKDHPGVDVRVLPQEEIPDEFRRVKNWLNAHGVDALVVERSDGKPMAAAGVAFPYAEGVVALDVNMEQKEAFGVALHELTHNLDFISAKLGRQLRAAIMRVDPKGFTKFLDQYVQSYLSWHEEAKDMPDSMKFQEGIAAYGEGRALLINYAYTANGRRALETIIRNDRSLAQKFLDWIINQINKLGLRIKSTTAGRLAELDKLLGTEGTTVDAIRGALIFQEALAQIYGNTPASQRWMMPNPIKMLPEAQRTKNLTEREERRKARAEAREAGVVTEPIIELGEGEKREEPEEPEEPDGGPEPEPEPEPGGGLTDEELEEEFDKEAEAEEEEEPKDTRTIADKLRDGEDLSGTKFETYDEEEEAEANVTLVANGIASEGRAQGSDPEEVFNQILELYGRQPRRIIRTSESSKGQRYSTPLPLGYLAGILGGVEDENITVFEPTVGLGSLLTAIDYRQWGNRDRVILGETDSVRRGLLRRIFGVWVNNSNALDINQMPDYGEYDVVLMNPPFGVIRNWQGVQEKEITIGDTKFTTTQQDHVIVSNALQAMHAEGKAVIIIGSQMSTRGTAEERQEARKRGYRDGTKGRFFNALYKNWNVTDHVTISGSLYAEQGASWPIDLIVIDGRGASELAFPGAVAPQTLESWDDVRSLLDPERRESYRTRREGAGRGGAVPGTLEGPPSGEAEPTDTGDQGGRAGVPPGDVSGGPGVGTNGPGRGQGQSGGVPADGGVEGPGEGVGTTGPGVAPEGGEDQQPAGEDGGRGEQPGNLDGEPGPLTDDELSNFFDEEAGEEEKTPEGAEEGVDPGKSDWEQGLDDIKDLFSLTDKNLIDEAKYKKMTGPFIKALDANHVDPADEKGIIRTLVGYFKEVLGFTGEKLQSVKAYVIQFVKDVRLGKYMWGERMGKQPSGKSEVAPELGGDQVAYDGGSKGQPMGTVIPSNMQTAFKRALGRIASTYGSVDTFVSNELGWTQDELFERLGQEQVDAVALSIDNIKRGAAFIVGDQTGVGKGRVVASMIHWARRNGHVPVFMTKDPALYADMFRDLYGIEVTDINPYVTNKVMDPLDLEENPETGISSQLKQHSGKEYDRINNYIQKEGALPSEYNAIFTTYDQANFDQGKYTERHKSLDAIADRAIFILDESHNAGGKELTSADQKKIEKGEYMPRSQWIRGLLEKSVGAMFSSATFAKNPLVMTLYFKTDMSKAFNNMQALVDLITVGGVPFQQVLSNMLVEAGQYVRRERTFDGVEFTDADVEVSHQAADLAAQTMSGMFDLDFQHMKRVRRHFREIILAGSGTQSPGDKSVGTTGADNDFASQMHNLIGQALLSMKAVAIADEAIKEWQAGRKPVIALDSTMGAILDRMKTMGQMEFEDQIDDISFRHAIVKYLQALRTVSITDGAGKVIDRVYITDEHMKSLGETDALARYNETMSAIEQLELAEMTISPIDAMLERMRNAGMNVDEITGREMVLNLQRRPGIFKQIREQRWRKSRRSGGAVEEIVQRQFPDMFGVLKARKHTPNTKKATMNRFNDGTFDALIINRSGATGFSLHAGETYLDQRQRIMLIAQPAPNIDDYKQMLGRIHRTGQVTQRITDPDESRHQVAGIEFENEQYGLPIYRVMFADIPHEMRAKAVLAAKMASLNANTTAMKQSGDTLEGVTDFINKHGDRVVEEVLREEGPVIVGKLHLEKRIYPASGRSNNTNLAKQASGRLPVLPVADQERIFRAIDEAYTAYVDYLDSIGQNDLEAKLQELDAQTVSSKVIRQETGPSPFEGAVYEERVNVRKLNPPLSYSEILKKVNKYNIEQMLVAVERDGMKQIAIEMGRAHRAREAAEALFAQAAELHPKEPGDEIDQKRKALRNKATQKMVEVARYEQAAGEIQARVRAFGQQFRQMPPGGAVRLMRMIGDEAGDEVLGVITNIRRKGGSAWATSGSDYEVTIYGHTGAAPLKLPFSKFISGEFMVNKVKDSVVRKRLDDERFSGREEKSIVTGNLVRGSADFLRRRGVRLAMYRTSEGDIKAGLILPGSVSAGSLLASDPLVLSGDQTVKVVTEDRGIRVVSKDGSLSIWSEAGHVHMEVRGSKRKSYTDLDPGNNFTQWARGEAWEANVNEAKARQILAAFEAGMKGFALHITSKNEKEKARKILGLEELSQGGEANLRQSIRNKEFMGFDAGTESGFDRFLRYLVDKDIRLLRFEERLVGQGGVVPFSASVYRAIERFPGKVDSMLRRFRQAYSDPIIKLIKDEKLKRDNCDLYVYAVHAPERNDWIAQLHRDEWYAAEVQRIRNEAKQRAVKAQDWMDKLTAQIPLMKQKLASMPDTWVKRRAKLEAKIEQAIGEITALSIERANALRDAKHAEQKVGPFPDNLPFQHYEDQPGGSGMSNKDAQTIREELENSDKGEAYKKLSALIDRMNARTRAIQAAFDLISHKTLTRWEERYQHYVPLRTSYEDQLAGLGQRFVIQHPESHTARGRTTLAHSPISYSIVQAERAIVRGQKNIVGRHFLNILRRNWTMMKKAGWELEEVDFEEHDFEGEGELIPKTPLPPEGYFSTKVKGKEVWIKIADPLILRAMKGIGDYSSGPIVRVLGSINRFLAQINTSWDPGFMLSNFFRDVQTAGINIAGEDSKAFAAQVVADAFSTKPQRAVFKGLRGKVDPDDEWLVAFHELDEGGGLTGYYGLPDYTATLKKIDTALKDADPSSFRQVSVGLKHVGVLIEDLNRAVENGVRLAAYKRAIERGYGKEEALSLAKNLTVNFNRKGEWGVLLNSLYLFYSASIGGTMRMMKALRHPTTWKIVTSISAAAFLLDMMNRAIGGDDDDGIPFYDKIPDWVKARNLIVMSPVGDGTFVKIPLPYGYNIFHAVGQVAGAVRSGAMSLGHASAVLTSTFWESFYPLGSEGSFAQTVLPTLADPIVQIAENKTFWGGPIRPTPWGSPAPPRSTLYWNSISPWAKATTDFLNRVTGGDDVRPGAIDFSPEDLEHVIEFAIGGAGRQFTRVEKGIEAAFRREPLPIRDVPILRRLLGQTDERFDIQSYYEQREDVLRAEKRLKEARGDFKQVMEVRKQEGWKLRLVPVMKKSESRLRKLRKMRKRTEDKALRQRIEQQMEQIRSSFARAYVGAQA